MSSFLYRILVIDDNPAIHEDFRRILIPANPPSELGAAAAALFGRRSPTVSTPQFQIDATARGQDGFEMIRAAHAEGCPYALAYVDSRMPNGWDGVETVGHIWQEFPELQIVICTAFSDYSWEEIQERLGNSDRFLILKKPFDNLEVRQLSYALAERARAEWELNESQQKLALEGQTVRRLGDDITELRRTQVELQQARDEANEANRAKSEFLSRVSHELRTPMNAILGFAQLLEMDDQLAEDHHRSVQQILKSGRHLLEMINEVLDISNMESGRLRLSPEPVAIDDMIALAVLHSLPLASTMDVSLEAESHPSGGAFVMADHHRLRQVLRHLLSNAIKYNRAGGKVTVLCVPLPLENALRISIQDTGIGMSPEKVNRLFTPFDRLDAEHSKVEGTGLGLSLSKQMIELMGGRLGVATVENHGSTFWIDLCLAESPLAALEINSSMEPEVVGHVVPRKVIYIDDNPSNHKLVERILGQRRGIKMFAASQGHSGIALVGQHHPDLILLDLDLPDASGTEVMATLLGEEATKSIPIAVISANATPGQIKRLVAAGAHAFLHKPLDVTEFLKVVDEVMDGRGKTEV